jgi:hypothetical protein
LERSGALQVHRDGNCQSSSATRSQSKDLAQRRSSSRNTATAGCGRSMARRSTELGSPTQPIEIAPGSRRPKRDAPIPDHGRTADDSQEFEAAANLQVFGSATVPGQWNNVKDSYTSSPEATERPSSPRQAAGWYPTAMEIRTEGIAPRLPIANSQPGLTGSGSTGAVLERAGMKQVFIGGALIGSSRSRPRPWAAHDGHLRQSMAICGGMSILIDRQIHSRESQVENRLLILRSKRWLAM